jgi:rare lipoprotein A
MLISINEKKMKNLVSILLLCAVTLMMTACSEVEFGSAMYKKFNRPSEDGSKGVLKVGKPYTVMGKTYYPAETYDYVETGIASWYGPGFHANKTASGERYDQNELTAAHRTLQMPSLVRVTNLDNGRSVVVRVNDRGPFARGRIMDVSAKAAELLGMVRTGTARVKLELLADESRALANAARNGKSTKGVEVAFNQTGQLPGGYYVAPQGPVASDKQLSESDLVQTAQNDSVAGHYKGTTFYPNPVVQQSPVAATQIFVQAGAFGQIDNAKRLAQKLGTIANSNVEPVQYAGKMLYKVRLGPLDSVRAADNVLSKVLANGQSDAIIVVQ